MSSAPLRGSLSNFCPPTMVLRTALGTFSRSAGGRGTLLLSSLIVSPHTRTVILDFCAKGVYVAVTIWAGFLSMMPHLVTRGFFFFGFFHCFTP
jgi:hypothetical protein